MSSPYSPPGTPGGYGYGYPPQQDYPPQQGYLQGGPVDFQNAVRLGLQNVLNFNGRASLSAYWWYALCFIIVNVVLTTFSVAVGSPAFSVLVDLVEVVIALCTLSIAARRLHDTNKSGWLLLLALIPIIGAIVLLILFCLPGKPVPNRFG